MGIIAEPAPAQDLLGSILSGQTMLLMDSSDVIINRDGSLKPTKAGKFNVKENFQMLLKGKYLKGSLSLFCIEFTGS